MTGRLAFILTLTVNSFFLYFDVTVTHIPLMNVLPFRLIPYYTGLMFFIITLTPLKKNYGIIRGLYLIQMISFFLMMYSINLFTVTYENFFLPLFLLIFAGYALNILGTKGLVLIYGIPVVYFMTMVYLTNYSLVISYLNAVGVMLILIIISVFEERIHFSEFSKSLQLEFEKERSSQLLRLILPEGIIHELEEKGFSEPKTVESATVVFTDFVNFTQISEKYSPKELLQELDDIFSRFDQIISKYGLQKIKTIGDAYMFAAGLPEPDPQHAVHASEAALGIVREMNRYISEKKKYNEVYWDIRIGIHTGKVIAGIIGKNVFNYDIWGDTVNVASRMEKSSEPGFINISEETFHRIEDRFHCEFRGEIKVKGKDPILMYFLKGRK